MPSRCSRSARWSAHASGSSGRPASRLQQRVHHLAEDVELQLRRGRVADPDRPRALVAGQPVELHLGQPPLARQAVHDLQVGGAPRGGAKEPRAPRLGFLDLSGVEQHEQRERGIPQPAEAVVPVTRAAELLGQGGRRRGDDPPGRSVGQRLERDQRALHDFRPACRRCRRLEAGRPLPPPCRRPLDRFHGVDRGRRGLVRGVPRQHEGLSSARGDREARARPQVLAARQHARAQTDRVRPGDGDDAVPAAPDPRDRPAVVEPQDQLELHLDLAGEAFDDADDVRRIAPYRHAIGHPEDAGVRDPLRLEDEGARPVAPAGLAHAAGRRSDAPAAVAICPQKSGEAGARVEAGQAQPVDGAVAPHQRSRLRVADERIVLQRQSHGQPSRSARTCRRPIGRPSGTGARPPNCFSSSSAMPAPRRASSSS